MVCASNGAPDLAWTWGFDHGPFKVATDVIEIGSWDCQVDMQNIG